MCQHNFDMVLKNVLINEASDDHVRDILVKYLKPLSVGAVFGITIKIINCYWRINFLKQVETCQVSSQLFISRLNTQPQEFNLTFALTYVCWLLVALYAENFHLLTE